MNRRCPECGKTLEEARQSGRLGCPACWDAFRVELSEILRDLHGTDRHPVAQTPVHQAKIMRKAELQAALDQALDREDYLEAKRLRDLMRELP